MFGNYKFTTHAERHIAYQKFLMTIWNTKLPEFKCPSKLLSLALLFAHCNTHNHKQFRCLQIIPSTWSHPPALLHLGKMLKTAPYSPASNKSPMQKQMQPHTLCCPFTGSGSHCVPFWEKWQPRHITFAKLWCIPSVNPNPQSPRSFFPHHFRSHFYTKQVCCVIEIPLLLGLQWLILPFPN